MNLLRRVDVRELLLCESQDELCYYFITSGTRKTNHICTFPLSMVHSRKSFKKEGYNMNTPKNRKLFLELCKTKKKKQMLLIFGPTGAAILILLVFLLLRAFSGNGDAKTVSSDQPETLEAESAGVQESETQRFQEPVSVTVSMAGDCTLGKDEAFNYSTSLNAYYDMYGPAYFFQNVKSVFDADDLTVVNFEGTLTDSTARNGETFAFKAPAEYAEILTDGGVEAVNVANNHSHDYGDQGFADTKENLKKAGITTFGYNETALMEVKGVKIGLVGIYELHDHLEREHQIRVNIQKVRAEGADLVFVVFHWGNEKDTVPDANQVTLAKLAIDNGADLVVGHHAHVLQGVTTYKGKTIAYGLGNFCFGGNSAPSDMDTMIFQQTFTLDTDGSVTSEEPNLIPCRISSDYYINNYQPTPATEDEAERILQKIHDRSEGLE